MYYESFSCSIQSDELASIHDENWVETLIHMEDVNRLMRENEEEKE